MRADLLHVVVPVFNPLRWKIRERQFVDFIEQVVSQGVRLTLVECATGDRPFLYAGDERYQHVGVRSNTICWIKESLINIGIARLPSSWKYVCWPDADIIFRDPNWASETVQTLQHYEVIQPWSEAIQLGPHGEFLDLHHSFCKMLSKGKPVVAGKGIQWRKDGNGPYDYPHPGYCWAATRNAIERLGGLFEYGVSGSGDHHMALGLISRIEESVPQSVRDACPELLDVMRVWQGRAAHHVNQSVGYMRGSIEHAFHGRSVDRKYWSRWSIFTDNKFNPVTDLKRNVYGVLELAGNKPQLTREIDNYMRSRAEDGNTA